MLQETCRRAFSTLVFPLIKSSSFRLKPSSCFPFRQFTSSTPYPLYYDLIHYRPARRHPRRPPNSSTPIPAAPSDSDPMDRAKRRYYRKRQKRMYGNSGSDSDSGPKSDFVELKPEIVEFPRLHAREQELHFHDAFAFPWEKDKHYRMVHQLEKKFFPDHSFDKAFVDPAAEREGDDRALLFFDEENEKREEKKVVGGEKGSEKKVEEFFRLLKKKGLNVERRSDVGEEDDGCQPFLSCRGTGLPAKWNGPSGTVLLVDKPKGWLTVKETVML